MFLERTSHIALQAHNSTAAVSCCCKPLHWPESSNSITSEFTCLCYILRFYVIMTSGQTIQRYDTAW